ncbi:excinuclease ABC subunit C [Priestia megaterium]|nr:excinuclease ABC subunit C [Priestia megaterium]
MKQRGDSMELREYIKQFPIQPGCYIMKDKRGAIIYIGKAKVLKSRVTSYFSGEQHLKTQRLLQEVETIEYVVTETEVEALLLENQMIKTHAPKYNILLKDDKTYPYIHITKEEHPRILLAREVDKKKGWFYGPYPNSKSAREVVDMLNLLYPLRKCTVLPKKECLYYHLGQCLAPCILTVTQKDYQPLLHDVHTFLRGDYGNVLSTLQERMERAAGVLQFEAAKDYRDAISHIQQLQPKQHVMLQDKVDRDIWGWKIEGDMVTMQVMHARQGAIVQRDVMHYTEVENTEDFMVSCILQFYTKHLVPKEVLLPPLKNGELLQQALSTRIHFPVKGQKKKLIEMALRNADHAFTMEQIRTEEKSKKYKEGIKELNELLGLTHINRIEIFDNAHLQGSYAVSGVVVYENGQFLRKEYRKFRLQHDNTRDDLASMREVLTRRYSRLLKENKSLPDVVIVDGGKTQWQAAQVALRQVGLNLPIISLMKDEKHRTHAILDTSGIERPLKRSSFLYRLVSSWQEEVHRFVITYFRSLQAKDIKASVLDTIKGIGPKKKRDLLKTFQSIEKIKKATIEELKTAGLSDHLAQSIYNTFNQTQDEE